jgi:hypothetical protein
MDMRAILSKNLSANDANLHPILSPSLGKIKNETQLWMGTVTPSLLGVTGGDFFYP